MTNKNTNKIITERNAIYDRLCSVLTEYEENLCSEAALYSVLVDIQREWENIITAQTDIELANEAKAYSGTDEDRLKDKALFVKNLGILLSQANTDVISAELTDNDTMLIRYEAGGTRKINIAADSYWAIIKDAAKYVM